MSYFKRVVIYILLINIIFEFIPNDSYKKYIKHISGVILILFVIEPISKYCNINYFESVVNDFILQNEVTDINKFMSGVNDIALNKSVEIYQSNIEYEIKTYLENCN